MLLSVPQLPILALGADSITFNHSAHRFLLLLLGGGLLHKAAIATIFSFLDIHSRVYAQEMTPYHCLGGQIMDLFPFLSLKA